MARIKQYSAKAKRAAAAAKKAAETKATDAPTAAATRSPPVCEFELPQWQPTGTQHCRPTIMDIQTCTRSTLHGAIRKNIHTICKRDIPIKCDDARNSFAQLEKVETLMIAAKLGQKLVYSTLDNLRMMIIAEMRQLKHRLHSEYRTQPVQPPARNELQQLNDEYMQGNDVPIEVQAEPFDDLENLASSFLNEEELLNLLADKME